MPEAPDPALDHSTEALTGLRGSDANSRPVSPGGKSVELGSALRARPARLSAIGLELGLQPGNVFEESLLVP